MGDNDSRRKLSDASDITRRKLLALSSAAAVGLAGCGGDGDTETTTAPAGDGGDGGDGGGTTTTTEETTTYAPATNKEAGVPEQVRPFEPEFPGEPEKTTIRGAGRTGFNPNEWNPWELKKPGTTGQPMLGQWWSAFHSPIVGPGYGENPPMVAASNVETKDGGCILEITIRDGLYYYTGEEVTTESVKIAWETRTIRNNQDPNALDKLDELNVSEELEVVDDKTFRWHFDSPQNAWNLGWNIPRGPEGMEFKPSVYGEWHQKYLDATTKDEVNSISEDTWEVSLGIEDFVNEGMGYGLWKPDLDDYSSTHWAWTIRDDENHPFAQSTNLERFHWEMVPDRTKRIERYKQGDFDLIGFNDQGNVRIENLNNITQRNQFTFNCIQGVKFNYGNKHLARRGVRQAIAYLVDTKQFAELGRTNGIAAGLAERQTSADTITANRWLGSDWIDENLIDYGPEAKPEKAAESMRNAGYTKEGDVWVGPDGDSTDGISFVSPSGIRKMQLVTQYAAGEMDSFGLKTETTFTEFGTWRSKFIRGNESWDVTSCWACGGYPGQIYYGADMSSISDWLTPPDFTMAGVPSDFSWPTAEECQPLEYEAPPLEEGVTTTPFFNHPIRPEIPQFGQEQRGDDPIKLYPHVMNKRLEQLSDRNAIVDIARQFGWYANWAMPQIALYDEVTKILVDQENFSWGKEDWSGYWAHRPTYHVTYGVTEGRT